MSDDRSSADGSRAGCWAPFSERPVVSIFGYSFGAGRANSLLVGVHGGMAIVSPPCRPPAAVMDEVAARGPVRAIVAPNAFHHMGVRAWHERFSDARLFAPAQSIERLARKTRLRGFLPISQAADLCDERIEFIDMPHYKTGELIVKVRCVEGDAWYVTDVIFNMTTLPDNPVAAAVFKWSKSAPGLKLNRIAPIFMVRDRAALWSWLRAEFDRTPPRYLIPAHGDVADFREQPALLKGLFPS